MKKFLLSVMALTLSLTTFAEEGDEIWTTGDPWFKLSELSDGTYAVINLGATDYSNITIPATAWSNDISANATISQIYLDSWTAGVWFDNGGDNTVMESLVISEGITKIANNAFKNATGLKYLTLPASLTAIGDYAFYGCDALEAIYFNGTAAPSLGTDGFKGNSEWDKIVTSAKIYCLEGDAVATFNQDPWTYFTGFYANNNVVLNPVDLYDNYFEDKSWYNGKQVNVTLHRTFEAGEWYTLCVPFAINEYYLKAAFGEDVKVAELSGSSKDGDNYTLTFTDVTYVTAGKPCLVKPSQDVANPSFDWSWFNQVDNPKVETEYFDMIGSYEQVSLQASDFYLADDNKLYNPATDGGVTMGGYRAYFQTKAGVPAGANAFVRFAGQGATAVDEALEAPAAEKVLRDGQIYIKYKGQMYDVQGRRIQYEGQEIK